MTRDAIAWIVDGSALLRRAPLSWLHDVRQEHAAKLAEFERERRRVQDYVRANGAPAPVRATQFEADIYCGPLLKGAHDKADGSGVVLWTTGEVGYHVDLDFPAFTVLLILNPAGLVACGKTRVQPPQPAGRVVGLRAHVSHALLAEGLGLLEMAKRGSGGAWYDTPPAEPWVALACNYEEEVDPAVALERLEAVIAKTEGTWDAC